MMDAVVFALVTLVFQLLSLFVLAEPEESEAVAQIREPRQLPPAHDDPMTALRAALVGEPRAHEVAPFQRALFERRAPGPWLEVIRCALPTMERDVRRPLLKVLLARPQMAWLDLMMNWPEEHLLLDADEVGAVLTALIARDGWRVRQHPRVARQLEAMLPWLVRRDDALAQLGVYGDTHSIPVLLRYMRDPVTVERARWAHAQLAQRFGSKEVGKLTVVRGVEGALTPAASSGDVELWEA